MRLSVFSLLLGLGLLLGAETSQPQEMPSPLQAFDLHRLVAFAFTDSDIADVLRHLVQLTGWAVFYDPAQVRGKVTIITPGKIPLAQALRLIQNVTHSHGYAIQVLLPHRQQSVPLVTVLTELSSPSEPSGVIIWRNADALDPSSHLAVCAQQRYPYPSLPFRVDVIVDNHQ